MFFWKMADVNQADVQYQELLKRILSQGEYEWNERTQTGTLSKFGDQMEFNLQEGFPILTTKKMAPRWSMEEMLFFLRGENDVKTLDDKGIDIWNKNAFNFFLDKHGLGDQFPKHTEKWDKGFEDYMKKLRSGNLSPEDRSLGRIYGVQWRDWRSVDSDGNIEKTDQVADMINKLKKGDRTSRSNIVTAQNPGEKRQMALPPCHLTYQTRVVEDKNRLDLLMYQRSCDTILGVPFNMAQYGLLSNMLSHETGLNPGYFQHMLGNVHFYTGVGERQEFLRDGRNLHELQSGVKNARDPQDYMEIFDWYMNSAPEEPANRKGYDHVPFALLQLARDPRESSQLEFKVGQETGFWDMIEMDKRDLARVSNYKHQGELSYQWRGETLKPVMAD